MRKNKWIAIIGGAIVVLAIALLGILYMFKEKEVVGKIMELAGDVEVHKKETAAPLKAFANMSFLQGDQITTKADGQVNVALSNSKTVFIAPDTDVKFDELVESIRAKGGKTLLKLYEGKVIVDVNEKLKGDSRFQIETSNAIMGVMGTEFVVYFDGVGTWVIVLEGEVEVTNEQGRQTLVPNDKRIYIGANGEQEISDIDQEQLNELLEDFYFTEENHISYLTAAKLNELIQKRLAALEAETNEETGEEQTTSEENTSVTEEPSPEEETETIGQVGNFNPQTGSNSSNGSSGNSSGGTTNSGTNTNGTNNPPAQQTPNTGGGATAGNNTPGSSTTPNQGGITTPPKVTEPTKEPEPVTVEPEPTKEPEPTVEPEPTKEPEPVTVEPEPTKEPEPEPPIIWNPPVVTPPVIDELQEKKNDLDGLLENIRDELSALDNNDNYMSLYHGISNQDNNSLSEVQDSISQAEELRTLIAVAISAQTKLNDLEDLIETLNEIFDSLGITDGDTYDAMVDVIGRIGVRHDAIRDIEDNLASIEDLLREDREAIENIIGELSGEYLTYLLGRLEDLILDVITISQDDTYRLEFILPISRAEEAISDNDPVKLKNSIDEIKGQIEIVENEIGR